MQTDNPVNLKREGDGIARRLKPLFVAIWACSTLMLSGGVVSADSFTKASSGGSGAEIKALEGRLVRLESMLRDLEDNQHSERAEAQRLNAGQHSQQQEANDQLMSQMEAELERPLLPEQRMALRDSLKERYQDIGVINGFHAVKFENEVQLLTAKEYEEFVEIHRQIAHRRVAKQALEDPDSELDLPKPRSQLSPAPIPVGMVAAAKGERPKPPSKEVIDNSSRESTKPDLLTARERMEKRRLEVEDERANLELTQEGDSLGSGQYRAKTVESSNSYRAQRD